MTAHRDANSTPARSDKTQTREPTPVKQPVASSASGRLIPEPPRAQRRPRVLSAHGHERVDPWYWLRERDDQTVMAYLEAENDYADAVLSETEELRKQIYKEILSRIDEDDLSVPVKKGPWMYFWRTRQGLSYPIHCRMKASSAASVDFDLMRHKDREDEEVILDENDLAAGHDYFALGNMEVSPDHRFLAYLFDTTGSEVFTLRIRDLHAGSDLDEEVAGTSYGLAWSNDESTLFYTRPDEAMRPWQLWRHTIGTPPEDDVCVHVEDDERFHIGVTRTKDDAYLLLEIESKVTSEVWALSADDPTGSFRVLQERRNGIEYSVAHRDQHFMLLTNDSAEDFRLVEMPDLLPLGGEVAEIVPHRPGVRITGFDLFENHLVVYERSDAASVIRVIDSATGAATTLDLPETPSTAWGGLNPEFSSRVLRYHYTSLITPSSVLEYDMDNHTSKVLKRQRVPSGYDPALYRTDRLWATSEDGTRVPISIAYREDTAGDLPAPALLYGYGSYEHSIDPMFSPARLSLLDRGFVYAIAHVRGGGEMGRGWYLNGKLEHKKNTFADFIACARHLIQHGWTSPDRLVARGGSAGGLLMGAVLNIAPELFRAIVAEVPFVDCLTTMMDPSLPLTAIEWEEWGNPLEDPKAYEWMAKYSPYDNVTSSASQNLPQLLVLAGINDPRVAYWEPVKWVAKIRAQNPASKVLLRIAMDSGHAGPSGRYAAFEEEALVLAFVADATRVATAPR